MFRRFGIIRDILTKYKNRYSNKEEVGYDMYGNKYYQIYDSENFPLKREVVYKHGIREPLMDPVWVDWLKGKADTPPNSQEINSSYDDYVKRKSIGQEFDKRDEENMQKFREALKKVQSFKGKKEFEPKTWNPAQNNDKKY
jgi:NADH:ubiquinone oxidoreductase subunit